ncbi:hypothetical protein [Pontibaca salina]|uniref:Uncharacterized protein n=1 Tax=Pontibaca salina TaxID=2795731 RepID=A0A934HUA9_9RHOB|nr:hypothetical protein [Pontibaca salina]MBI6630660.1 hypothetical protein [Pontibaca salina]
MKLTLHLSAGRPGDPDTTAHVTGDILRVNGTEYDLSAVPEGGCATPQGDHPFVGTIRRADGLIHAAIIWGYDSTAARPDQGSQPIVIDITQGRISVPVARRTEVPT